MVPISSDPLPNILGRLCSKNEKHDALYKQDILQEHTGSSNPVINEDFLGDWINASYKNEINYYWREKQNNEENPIKQFQLYSNWGYANLC